MSPSLGAFPGSALVLEPKVRSWQVERVEVPGGVGHDDGEAKLNSVWLVFAEEYSMMDVVPVLV